MIQLRGLRRRLRRAHRIGALTWLTCGSALADGSADSVTAFDDLEVEVLDEQREAS